jgi:hypothetical protein
MRRSLLVFPNKQTTSEWVAMSQRCQKQKNMAWRLSKIGYCRYACDAGNISMTEGITNVAGIEIPSADPIFLAVVGVHVLLGLASTVTGAIAMLSEKRAGCHPRYGTIYF